MNYFLFEADNFGLNLIFSEGELEVFRDLWNENVSVRTIVSDMGRKTSEIALLVFDHAEQGLLRIETEACTDYGKEYF